MLSAKSFSVNLYSTEKYQSGSTCSFKELVFWDPCPHQSFTNPVQHLVTVYLPIWGLVVGKGGVVVFPCFCSVEINYYCYHTMQCNWHLLKIGISFNFMHVSYCYIKLINHKLSLWRELYVLSLKRNSILARLTNLEQINDFYSLYATISTKECFC